MRKLYEKVTTEFLVVLPLKTKHSGRFTEPCFPKLKYPYNSSDLKRKSIEMPSQCQRSRDVLPADSLFSL